MTTDELTGATWIKSSRSNGNANCVEVAALTVGRRAVRDSKNPGPALILPHAAWLGLAAELAR